MSCRGPATAVDAGAVPQASTVMLTDLLGAERSLDEWKGQVIFVNFWATWCPPCLEEIPDLIELRAAYTAQGVEFVGIAMDVGGSRVVQPFVERQGISYPILLGNADIARRFKVIGVPVSFIINRNGDVIRRFDGPYRKPVFDEALRKALEGGR